MKPGDLVRNKKTQEIGLVEWSLNQTSWWHRKKGLTAVAVLMTMTGKVVWWPLREVEVL